MQEEKCNDCIREAYIDFSARIDERLKGVAEGIARIETNHVRELGNAWTEINKVKDKVSQLYLRVGIAAGGIALIVTIVSLLIGQHLVK